MHCDSNATTSLGTAETAAFNVFRICDFNDFKLVILVSKILNECLGDIKTVRLLFLVDSNYSKQSRIVIWLDNKTVMKW